MNDDPFALLGLPARADLSDDDMRAAWRRVAAATHPDRDDGGDPARFGAAAAAYAMLRTSDGRGEALAELAGAGGVFGVGGAGGVNGADRHRGSAQTWATRWIGVIAVRAGVAAAVAVLAFLVAGWAPSSIGVLAGMLTWLLVSAGRTSGAAAWHEVKINLFEPFGVSVVGRARWLIRPGAILTLGRRHPPRHPAQRKPDETGAHGSGAG